ncbi:MAG: hypothetical protein IH595_05245 [Bacteroidales bacterium]|nr:hypothetical protein [Bacteroidales bacterium]
MRKSNIRKQRTALNPIHNQSSSFGQIKKKISIFLLLIPTIIFSIAPTKVAFSQTIPEKAYSGMRWRLVGPFRAGWATMAAGIPEEPNTFYFGAAGGGVWKTDDAGRTWQPLMQHQQASSIGALAIAPSNPKIIYAGTGQVALRYDILPGDGVYKSVNGGKTWTNVGLKDSRHIGRILIDSHNPDQVLVAAMGNAFKPNTERGVFLTTDGGKTWKHVLYVNENTGAVDLASDPKYPSTVYAALWQMRMYPWLAYFLPQAGPGSGIYKSTDGGLHWKKLSGNGLPADDLGRIGLGVAEGSNGSIVYASIQATANNSGLYRSNDGGNSWQLVNDNASLADSYFSRITVNPKNPDIVYVMGRSIKRSDDGGKHFSVFKGSPGGDDYHFLWINPDDTTHMITASDQGAVVTVNNGRSWSSWYNQPTGQFYHLAVDDRFPYRIYSGQQDNGTVEILSRGPYGVISIRDWHPVGGDERDYDVPKPGNPDWIFGSGLGGKISRFNEITRQSAEISPWPVSSYGALPTTVKYRYTWITPLVFSHIKPYPLYFGAQYLFRSVDNGDHWKIISPDLTGVKPGTEKINNPDPAQARAIGYGVIYSISPSPIDQNVIWVGTDNGLIQLSKDGGKHWNNVTPPSVPLWGRIDAIAPSPFSTDAAYVSVDLHRLGESKPLILKTSDDGKTWKTIIKGIPSDEYMNVVKADPVKKGLLYASTNRSIYVSFNDGDQWQPLTLNFPTTSVRDLVVHNGDLIAGTQGRGIWILDDLEPLREMTQKISEEPVHLFSPASAWRIRNNENHDTPWPPSTPLGQNPPSGAIIDYWLKADVKGPVTLTIKDSTGNVVEEFSSNEMLKKLPAHRYFEKGWVGKEERLENTAGMHRFVWNLRYPRPSALEYHYSIAAVWTDGTPLQPMGPMVMPGHYTVVLSVNGTAYSKPLVVKMDPRVHVNKEALAKQTRQTLQIDALLNRSVALYNQIGRLEDKKDLSAAKKDSISTLLKTGHPNLASSIGVLTSLATDAQRADAAPVQGETEVFSLYKKQIEDLVSRWAKIDKK